MADSRTSTIQYDEGEAYLSLEDGTVAERGKPVTVDVELANRLCEQEMWHEVGASKPSEKTSSQSPPVSKPPVPDSEDKSTGGGSASPKED